MNHSTPAANGQGCGAQPVEEPNHEVVIVGAGFSGMGAAIALMRAGFDDLVILERGNDVGGSWRDHSYPGLAVDVPSISYSYHFDMNPDWSRIYAPGDELYRYAQDIADKYQIRRRLRLNTEVLSASFDESGHFWRLQLRDGSSVTARFLFSCHGILVTPRDPVFPGMETFEGKVLRSMEWDHSYDLEGKRVAVIGTGATGLQIIPAIAPQVEALTVYQRTPIWVVPKPDAAIPESLRRLFRLVPAVQHGMRWAASAMIELILTISVIHHKQAPFLAKIGQRACAEFLKSQVHDPVLREKLTPTYQFGCKRPSFSNVYYKTYLRENVELVTEPIAHFTPSGIRSADECERNFDAVVLATGFKLFDVPYDLRGTDGISLNDFWDLKRRQTFEGTSVHGYPNAFLVPGPYAVSGSWFSTINLCVTHGLRVMKEARQRGATRVEVSAEAHQDAHQDAVRRANNTVYLDPGCNGSNSYYIDQHGDAPFLRPSSTIHAWLRQRSFDVDAYEYSARSHTTHRNGSDTLRSRTKRRLSTRLV